MHAYHVLLRLYLPGVKLAESTVAKGAHKWRARGIAMQSCRPISGVQRVMRSECYLAIRVLCMHGPI